MAANRSHEVEEMKKIAQEAIQNINRMTSLLDNKPTTSMNPATSALSELQRRFPTTSNSSRSTTTAPRSRSSRTTRYRPYHSTAAPGRPVKSSIVTRDVFIIEKGHEHMPTKTEKVEMERKRRVVSGFDVDRNWGAEELKKQLSSLLKGTEMEDLRFEIVKNCGGTLVTPNTPNGRMIDANLLFKSISPTGHIFIRLLDYLPHVDQEIEEMLSKSPFDSDKESDNDVVIVKEEQKEFPATTSTTTSSTENNAVKDGTSIGANSPLDRNDQVIDCPFDIESIINKAKAMGLTDPIETLRYLQEEINEGRTLDLICLEETLDGDVNIITVNRDSALKSTFSELEFINNYRLTFQVDFMGEECSDQGGPRKQWIRVMNKAIKEKYFDKGIRKYLSKDYFYVGVMVAIAMLQNGEMPTYIEEDVLQEILSSCKSSCPCILEIQRGLEKLGMLTALRQLPFLAHLLRPGAEGKLTVPILLQLLKPKFSEEGSNALKFEREVYQLFVRYMREVASGRRVCGEKTLELSNMLEFVTGASKEPRLGFAMHPAIQFVIPDEVSSISTQMLTTGGDATEVKASFVPTAHTCGNMLFLTRPCQQFPLPSEDRLFSIYDMAFSQDYFGKV